MPSIDQAPKDINFTCDPIYIDITTDKIVGGVPQEDNVSLHVQVWLAGDTDTFLASFNPPYYKPTAIADFDLSKVLDLTPYPPVNTLTIAAQVEPSMFTAFFIKYADIYGTPPEIEPTLQVSEEFIAIAGETRYMNGMYTNFTPVNAVMLHAWNDEKGNIWFKQVRKDQPEFLYMYHHDGGSAPMVIKFFYTDGTIDTSTAATLTLEAKKVSSVKAGWNDLSLDNDVDDSKELAYYTIQIGNGTIMYYALDEIETEQDHYFLYFNGCGGMETFRASGYEQQDHEVDRSTFEVTRWKGSNFVDGFIQTSDVRGRKSLTVNSGYYSRAYCEHLQQLLYADVWYIDQERTQYVKYNVTASSLQVYNANDDLYFIELTLAPAFMKQHFTNFKI